LIVKLMEGKFEARLLCDGTNMREGGEIKGKQDSGVSKAVPRPSKAETSYQLKCLPLTPAVREYGLVRFACTQNLSSAHVPSHCNRALHV
jgi:hypothetical protein